MVKCQFHRSTVGYVCIISNLIDSFKAHFFFRRYTHSIRYVWWHMVHISDASLFLQWTGNMSILCASTSLMLRTYALDVCLGTKWRLTICSIALWERQKSIVIPLGVLCLAHWALLYRTMFIVTAAWEERTRGCVVTGTNPSLLNSTFFFSTWPYCMYFIWHGVTLFYLYSNGFWFHHLGIHCSLTPEETLCSDRSLEITIPGRPCVFPCIFLNQLYPSR